MGSKSAQDQDQDMNMIDLGEKVQTSKLLFLPRKKLSFPADLDGDFNGAIFIFLLCILWSKTSLIILHMNIFETFGRYESHFQTD